jgi:hypothetical protein
MSPNTHTDITVNAEGFWLLQALLDIRHVAPEIRCRPFVSTDSEAALSEHPGVSVMSEQGIVVDGQVHDQVAARMRTLAAPDVEVLALLSRAKPRNGASGEDADATHQYTLSDNELRVVLARRDDRWVSAVRAGAEITVDDVSVNDAASIAALVLDALDAIQPSGPAPITSVNVPVDEATEAVKSWQESGFDVFAGGQLRRMGLNAATVSVLSEALSEPRAEAVVYARQYRDDVRAPSVSVLSIKDGPSGRIAMYQQPRTPGSGQDWMAICPATPQLVRVGVKTVLDSLPYGAWERHRRGLNSD